MVVLCLVRVVRGGSIVRLGQAGVNGALARFPPPHLEQTNSNSLTSALHVYDDAVGLLSPRATGAQQRSSHVASFDGGYSQLGPTLPVLEVDIAPSRAEFTLVP